ncbi:unnamed protein product, partial [Ixodes hexagonus]
PRVEARPPKTESAVVTHRTRSPSPATPTGSPPSPTLLVTAGADVVSWKLRKINLDRKETSTRTKTKKKPRRRTSVVPEEQVPREADDPTSPLKDPRRPPSHVDPSVPSVKPVEEDGLAKPPATPQPAGLVSLKTDEVSQGTSSGSEPCSTGAGTSSQQPFGEAVEGVEETRLHLQVVDLGRRNVRSSSSEATSTALDENAASMFTVVPESAGPRDPRSSSFLRRASIQSLDPGPDHSHESPCTELREVADESSTLEDPRRCLEVEGDAEQEPQVPVDSSRGPRTKRTRRDRRRARQVLTPRKRHVNQLFVRGDNVVAVSLLPV